MQNHIAKRGWQLLAVGSSVVITLTVVAGMVSGATTISSNVNTGGTLTVSGASTLTGNIAAAGHIYGSSTVQATGNVFWYGVEGIGTSSPAASQVLAVHGSALFAGNITSVASITATGTLNVTGLTTLVYASTTGLSVANGNNNLLVGGYATTSAANGNITSAGSIVASSTSSTLRGVGVATSTPSAEFAAEGSATTTLYLHSTAANTGACIELKSSVGGTVFRAYATAAGPLYVEVGACK